jgi:L-methionine (R)-S-oxide reductase
MVVLDEVSAELPLAQRYGRIHLQLVELLKGEPQPTARMATIAALLHHKMPLYSWTGFYLIDDAQLVVGPYQGPLACLRLPRNQGVCWAAVNRREAVIVPDVHAFPGHIACDSRSRSEIVVPVWEGHSLRGVLDVDSTTPAAFSAQDAAGLSRIAALAYPPAVD